MRWQLAVSLYALAGVCALMGCSAGSLSALLKNRTNSFEFFMPRVAPNLVDNHLCMRMLIRDNFYIVGFEPRASMDVVHQMTLYGCSEPGSNDSVWRCNEPAGGTGGAGDARRSPCRAGSQVVYGWGRNATGFQLPRHVGFHVGPRTPIPHLVLQVHYLRRYTADGKLIEIDSAGIILSYTKKHKARAAGVLMLGALGRIPARSVERLESVCLLRENNTIYPIAFRVHTHRLGEAVSGYAVRQGAAGDEWTTLAKASPRRQQGFLPVRDATPLRPGDILAARCTMNNTADHVVWVGKTEQDEICALYLLYWVERAPLQLKYCVSPGAPNFSWSRSIHNFRNVPDMQASIL